MKIENVELAIAEAKRFIAKAELLLVAKQTKRSYIYGGVEHFYADSAPKQSGATRRASMDLTRALAEMRKP